jgi:hypothetical protein
MTDNVCSDGTLDRLPHNQLVDRLEQLLRELSFDEYTSEWKLPQGKRYGKLGGWVEILIGARNGGGLPTEIAKKFMRVKGLYYITTASHKRLRFMYVSEVNLEKTKAKTQ